MIAADRLRDFVGVPLKLAVRLCEPAVKTGIVRVAVPPLTFSVPRIVVPSRKVTVPPPGAGLTEAVSVTGLPTVVDVMELPRVVVVAVATGALLVTVWMTGDETPRGLPSVPAYEAVIEWVPTPRFATFRVATPCASVTVPRDVVPSRNVIAPLTAGLTAALRVTACPSTEFDLLLVSVVETAI